MADRPKRAAQAAPGDGRKSKRNKAKYLHSSQRKSYLANHAVPLGLEGFLISSMAGREKECMREMLNVLDKHWDLWKEKRASRQDAQPRGPSGVKPEESAGLSAAANADTGGLPGEARSAATTMDGGPVDIERELQEELEGIRSTKKARFVRHDTGCKALVFIQLQSPEGEDKEKVEAEEEKGEQEEKEEEAVSEKGKAGGATAAAAAAAAASDGMSSTPTSLELAESVVRHVAETKSSSTRYTLRVLPVEVTCYASEESICKAIEPLIAAHFPTSSTADQSEGSDPGLKFAIVIEARANAGLDKMGIIKAVASMVPSPHSVDLSNPQRTIMLQIIKTTCCVSVVSDFRKLSKYNVQVLAGGGEEGSEKSGKKEAEKERETGNEGVEGAGHEEGCVQGEEGKQEEKGVGSEER